MDYTQVLPKEYEYENKNEKRPTNMLEEATTHVLPGTWKYLSRSEEIAESRSSKICWGTHRNCCCLYRTE